MIDIFRLLAELNAAGVSNRQVARQLGLHTNTIHHWKNSGSLPRVDHYLGLLVLYRLYVAPQSSHHIVSINVSSSVYKLTVTPAI